MARKEIVFVVSKDGRDKGKRFHIKEMPSRQAEKWAARAVLALGKSGVDMASAKSAGWQGLAMAGVQALQFMEFPDAEPLLDEMLECVTFEPSPGVTRPLVDTLQDGNDIDEVQTRIDLRVAIFKLHADFFINAGPSNPN